MGPRSAQLGSGQKPWNLHACLDSLVPPHPLLLPYTSSGSRSASSHLPDALTTAISLLAHCRGLLSSLMGPSNPSSSQQAELPVESGVLPATRPPSHTDKSRLLWQQHRPLALHLLPTSFPHCAPCTGLGHPASPGPPAPGPPCCPQEGGSVQAGRAAPPQLLHSLLWRLCGILEPQGPSSPPWHFLRGFCLPGHSRMALSPPLPDWMWL